MALYRIVSNGASVGELVLRLRSMSATRLYHGDVGYRVREQHRGQGYAAAALRQLPPIALKFGFTELWFTCAPDNVASRKTLERAGAAHLETIQVPQETQVDQQIPQTMLRYRLIIAPTLKERCSHCTATQS
ncbi:GNAT family N-acetyltransferase [Pelagerythrobacter aerophilus]